MGQTEFDSSSPQELQNPSVDNSSRPAINPNEFVVLTGAKVVRHKISEMFRRKPKEASRVECAKARKELAEVEVLEGEVTEDRRDTRANSIDSSLQTRLNEGPSSIISKGIVEAVRAKVKDSIEGVKSGKKIPFASRLLNPGATLRNLKAMAEELEADAEFNRVCSREIAQTMRIAAADLRHDLFYSQIESMREQLEPWFPQFCKDRNIDPPKRNSVEEIVLLHQLDGIMAYNQEQGQRAVEAGRKLAERKVKISYKTARDRQDAELLPAANEAALEAHGEREKSFGEKIRHGSDIVFRTPISFVIGIAGAITGGVEKGVENVVRAHPEVGLPLAFASYLGVQESIALIHSSAGLALLIGTLSVSVDVGIAIGWGKAILRKNGKNNENEEISQAPSKKLKGKQVRA